MDTSMDSAMDMTSYEEEDILQEEEEDCFEGDDYDGDYFEDYDISMLLNSLGVETNMSSSSPMYEHLSRRLMSFTYWPSEKDNLVESIASAGFYYTGKRDCTMCFSCGVILEDWKEEHDPWARHALSTDDCIFMRWNKGNDYIDDIKEKEMRKGSASRMIVGFLKTVFNKICTYTLGVYGTVFGNLEQRVSMNQLPKCVICLDNPRSVVYLPCRHMISCTDCGIMDTCALCRQTVRAYVKVFVP